MNFGGSHIRCEAISGRGALEGSSGQADLELRRCREGVTVFGFRCGSGAQPRGPAHSSALGAQLMRGTDNAPKVMFLGLRASFNCADVMHFKVEGFLAGHIDRKACGRARSRLPLALVLFAHGSIGSQPAYDVYVSRDRKTYEISDPWQMRFSHSVTLRC
jgi:hypothetical protein